MSCFHCSRSLVHCADPLSGSVRTLMYPREFGEKDQRVRISSDRWPWVAIGRINVIAGTWPQLCTGTVIGSRRVLTAAQCLFDARINNWVKPSSVHFVLGQEKDKNLGHSVVESFVKSPDFAYRLEERPRWDAIDPKMIRRNWAILILRDELPVKPIPLRTITSSELSAGSPGEFAARWVRCRPRIRAFSAPRMRRQHG